MILSLGIIDIISTGQSDIGIEFAFLTALLPHKLCFSPHFRRTFCVFHRTFAAHFEHFHRTCTAQFGLIAKCGAALFGKNYRT